MGLLTKLRKKNESINDLLNKDIDTIEREILLLDKFSRNASLQQQFLSLASKHKDAVDDRDQIKAKNIMAEIKKLLD